jgi:hypothetical protein
MIIKQNQILKTIINQKCCRNKIKLHLIAIQKAIGNYQLFYCSY